MSKHSWLQKRPDTVFDWLSIIFAGITFYLLLGNIKYVSGAIGTVLNILTPFAGGIVMAYVLNPIVVFFQSRVMKGNKKFRWASILLAYLVAVLIIAALVQFIEMFLMKSMPALYESLGIYLPLITTNCAVLGVANLNVSNGLDFISAIIYGFSAGIGFTLAIVLFASVRERLEYADYPKCFKGFPIALVAASLLSIAFMGFQGLSIF